MLDKKDLINARWRFYWKVRYLYPNFNEEKCGINYKLWHDKIHSEINKKWYALSEEDIQYFLKNSKIFERKVVFLQKWMKKIVSENKKRDVSITMN